MSRADDTQKLIGAVDHQHRADATLGQHVHHLRNRCGGLNGRDLVALVFQDRGNRLQWPCSLPHARRAMIRSFT